jgi:hypothetical protein
MDHKIHNLTDINLDNILCGTKIINNNISYIPLLYRYNNINSPLIIKIPELYCGDLYEKTKKYLLLCILTNDIDKTSQISKMFDDIDIKIVNIIKKNINNWDIQNQKYKSITYNCDSSYNVLKLQLINTNTFSTAIYSNKKELLNVNNYSKYINGNCFIKSIIELSAIIIKNNEISILIKPHQLLVLPNNFIITKYAFNDSDNNVENENKTDTSNENENENENEN